MTTDTKVSELPELPGPEWKATDGVSPGVYSAAQVREYGMFCYEAALARQEADTAAPVGQVALFEMFSKLKTSGGCIVSSGDCGTMEIVDAQARGDFTADADGFGFVLRPHAWLQKHSRFASGANDSCEQRSDAPPSAPVGHDPNVIAQSNYMAWMDGLGGWEPPEWWAAAYRAGRESTPPPQRRPSIWMPCDVK